MQKLVGLDAQNSNTQNAPRKANISKIQSSAPALDSNIRPCVEIKYKSKAERNQNIADALYQGGHSQTAIALVFDLSSSTVSRVIKEYGNGGSI
ncbi:MAG: helix-turn-helix domain-containing protein [Pseudomonadota bacterium]